MLEELALGSFRNIYCCLLFDFVSWQIARKRHKVINTFKSPMGQTRPPPSLKHIALMPLSQIRRVLDLQDTEGDGMRAFTCENRFLQVFHDKFIQDSLTGATPKGFILLDEDQWGKFYIFAVVASFPECVNAFALVVRPPTEQENLLFSFQLTGEETVKSAWLRTLCRHVANTICRADAVSPNTQKLLNFPRIQTSELIEWPSP